MIILVLKTLEIIKYACEAPFRAIMENAGLTADVVWNDIKAEIIKEYVSKMVISPITIF